MPCTVQSTMRARTASRARERIVEECCSRGTVPACAARTVPLESTMRVYI